MPHRRYGLVKSPSIEAAATIIAASGPKRTAANSIGRAEIDSSTVQHSFTLPRSAKAAATASPSTTRGGPIDTEPTIKAAAIPAARLPRSPA